MGQNMSNLLYFFPNGFNANDYATKTIDTGEPPQIRAWKHLTDLGYKPPLLQQGKLMRFPDAQDIAKNNLKGQGGWALYVEFNDGNNILGIMSYGSWHDGEKQTWSSVSQDYMDQSQRTAFLEAIEAARRVRDEEERRLKEIAQAEFVKLWDGLPEAKENHPYLTRKQCKPHGIKQDGQNIVIPMASNGRIVGIQTIAPDGEKRFKKHSSKGFFILGDTEGAERLLICEGYATAASIYEATGCPVAVAFDAGNLYPVTTELKSLFPNLTLAICADDDKHGETNTGLRAAQFIKDRIGIRTIAPITNGTDFNDMAAEKGLPAVKELIESAFEKRAPMVKKTDKQEDSMRPPGALGAIYDYYNETSGWDQKGFAIQTALAIGSVMCGRNFRTDNENFTSIFLLNVGETATGKEHCKTVTSRVMRSVGMDHLIIGDGFTSAGGVMTELLRKPRCISIIDEFGLYMEAANSKGNSNQKEANSYLMQAIGRCHEVMRGKNYSAQGAGKKDADLNDKKVCNPSLTLVGITTPRTFMDAISSKDIHSGFLNRFIVCVSKTEPAIRGRVQQDASVPTQVTDWLLAIKKRSEKKNAIEVATDFANHEIVKISDPAWEIEIEFEREMIANIKKYREIGLDGIFGRAAEMAHRIALIIALSRDATTSLICDTDMLWATNYIRERYNQLFLAVKDNMRENQFEGDCKEFVLILEEAGGKESRTKLMRRFKKLSIRQFDEMVSTLVASDQIAIENSSNGVGRPATYYVKME